MKTASSKLLILFTTIIITSSILIPFEQRSIPIPVTSKMVDVGERYIPDRLLFGPAPTIPDNARPVAVTIPGHTFPVVQQPAGQPGFVSVKPAVVTQFEMASEMGGSVGLLAHNFLAGGTFSKIQRGQQVGLFFSEGVLRTYRVVQVLEFQALQPTSVYSDFINLTNPSDRLDSTAVFEQVYQRKDRLVLQTCIERFGNESWGRLFVIAVPIKAMANISWQGAIG